MTDYRKLYSGISKVAWGYFFIYIHININTVDLLPSFIGYIFLISAINHLKDEERELSLLHTLGTILVLWHGAEWILSWVAISLEGAWQFVDIIINLVNLYFHFQLLTNLAAIAAKYQPKGYAQDVKLLRYRTLQTIALTVIDSIFYLYPWLSELWTIISGILLCIHLIVLICLMKALFGLRKCLFIDNGLRM